MTSAVGIDIGGSKIAACAIDLEHRAIVATRRIATSAERGGAAVLDDCVSLVAQLTDGTRGSIPVGIGICELVNPAGAITSAVTVDWQGIDLAARFDGPVLIESDVRAAAVGEARWGAARESRNFVYVTVGTGVAFTLVQDGRPWAGAHGNALILGAPPVERSASGKALAREAGVARAEEVFGRGDGDALVRHGSRQLGRAMAWLVNALDPELMVVGGGLGLRDDYREAAVAEMRTAIEAVDSRDVPVVPAELGPESGAVGAALMAADRSLTR